jgi:CDP-diacylglycerol--glycerol-3-phosphate 3-phosphatidyltransferase
MASYLLGLLDVFSSYSYRLLPYTTNTSDYTLEWPKPEIHPHYMDKQLGRAVGDYQASNINQAWRSREQDPAHDTVIFPICQSGGLGVREEEACVDMLLNSLKPPKDADSPPVVNLTSGYFSLFEPYQNLALKSPADWKIVAASPRVRSFHDII